MMQQLSQLLLMQLKQNLANNQNTAKGDERIGSLLFCTFNVDKKETDND